MYLKILYLDSSAILSWFLKQDGGVLVQNIHNEQTELCCSLNISSTVKDEVIERLNEFYRSDLNKFTAYKSLLDDFNLVDKDKKDTSKMESRRSEILNKYPVLKEKLNSQDSIILNEMFSYLDFFAGVSHPILISCDNLMNQICRLEGYRVFNPRVAERSIDELRCM